MASSNLEHAFVLHKLIDLYTPDTTDHSNIRRLLQIGALSDHQWVQTASLSNTESGDANDNDNITAIDRLVGGHLTPLHAACKVGNLELVQILVDEFAHPVNALTENCYTAAEVARLYHAGGVDNNVGEKMYQYLKLKCITSELILNSMHVTNQNEETSDYLQHPAEYKSRSGLLFDHDGNGVMMDWELPLMKKHAQQLCHIVGESPSAIAIDEICLNLLSSGEVVDLSVLRDKISTIEQTIETDFDFTQVDQFVVLNVGFGLGIIDTFIHAYLLALSAKFPHTRFIHYIIEAHPDVLFRMQETHWINSSPWQQSTNLELRVIEKTHQQAVDCLAENGVLLDSVFFDTFGENYQQFMEFRDDIVLPFLKSEPHSVFSWFNGFGCTNEFFADVYRTITEMDANEVGMEVALQKVDLSDKDQSKIKRPYYTLGAYYLPTCKFQY
ncbi:hypothetical protein MIR68_003317 [Amoeboaphelidium protococcarum]|nr:hypothetical protein MIR68_003317 [Amoeboaphelidium protococcarum]